MAQKLLLIDTCGSVGSVALALGAQAVLVKSIAERASSALLLRVIDDALAEAGWKLANLDAVGVVSGPGSFTGVRVGLAATKGLCEGLGVPMAAASRLEVLAEAAGGIAVALEAGRGQMFVRSTNGIESLMPYGQFAGEIAVCEETLAVKLPGARVVAIDAGSALQAVRRTLQHGGTDIALADAIYVRDEAQMYRQKGAM